ncbi:hypothetical protein [Streptomyces sp. NPDC002769]|uniref:hypothetical protein n=1 Tax=Streptomyces sp. NPDC002769 TaxID=3154542 RepID=UPI0033306490
MRGSRAGALLAGLSAALTLAACGVPPSDVIQAGEPASGMSSPSTAPRASAAITLFFLRDGDLAPYGRKVDDPGDLGAVVRLLFGGPTASEAATATTKLPRLKEAPEVTIDDDGALSVLVPRNVPPLSHLAMLQLACTVAARLPDGSQPADAAGDGTTGGAPTSARPAATPPSVRVRGNGWTMTQPDGSCPDPLQP